MISTLKYGLLRQALLMDYSVLVVDLDLVFLRNPFEHLYRDADVEASTDGFTEAWAGDPDWSCTRIQPEPSSIYGLCNFAHAGDRARRSVAVTACTHTSNLSLNLP